MRKITKNVAVIGAGAAGLTATKRLTEHKNDFVCCTFEQSNSVGGTWVYTDKVGKNEYGLPVHSSMYKGLRTNLPKEIMELPEFPHRRPVGRSYLSSEEIFNYFEEYADHFDLRKYIKFYHHVNEIIPTEHGKWEIKVTDLTCQKQFVYYFDAVIVCIGNYSNSVYPKMDGSENFKGIQIHSHDYKLPTMYTGINVLVIGGGSSGLDITNQLSKHAKRVYFSHHNDKLKNIQFSENVTQKSDVQKITENGVIFNDETVVEVDAILYCTGYEYKYPFLSPKCGIKVENVVVKSLYKQLINIEHPTMCIVGIPRDCPGFTMFDLQVRCFLNILSNKVILPSKSEMYRETEMEIDAKTKKRGKEKYYHVLSKEAKEYFDSISELGTLPLTRKVVFDVYFSGLQSMLTDFHTFRNRIYRLIDDKTYMVE